MSFLARNSLRTIARTTPRVRVNARSRAFATPSNPTALEKYVAEEKALRHHAAGKYTMTYSMVFSLIHSTEASDLWRKIRCVVCHHSK